MPVQCRRPRWGPPRSSRPAESAPSPACAAPAPGCRLRRLRVALGTWVAIEASAPSEAAAAQAIEAAYAALAEVERRMHPEREGSDIARINSAPLRAHTPVHASTWEVLRLAQQLNELTQGVFDPCLPSSPGRVSDLALSGGSAGSAPCGTRRPSPALHLRGVSKSLALHPSIPALRTHRLDA